jgi:cbb3-type cytochrome oxidase maturation protein
MSVVMILILASLAVAVAFLGGFIWAVRSGQYEDTLTPSLRVLAEEGAARAGDDVVPAPALESAPGSHPSVKQ